MFIVSIARKIIVSLKICMNIVNQTLYIVGLCFHDEQETKLNLVSKTELRKAATILNAVQYHDSVKRFAGMAHVLIREGTLKKMRRVRSNKPSNLKRETIPKVDSLDELLTEFYLEVKQEAIEFTCSVGTYRFT